MLKPKRCGKLNSFKSSVFSDLETFCQITFSLQTLVLGGMSCSVFVVFRWEATSMWQHLQMQTMYFRSTQHFQNLGTWCLNIHFSSQTNNIREKFEFSPKDMCDFPFSRKERLRNKSEASHCLFFLSAFHQDMILIDYKALSTHLTWNPLW